jgi:hypothetical protein
MWVLLFSVAIVYFIMGTMVYSSFYKDGLSKSKSFRVLVFSTLWFPLLPIYIIVAVWRKLNMY